MCVCYLFFFFWWVTADCWLSTGETYSAYWIYFHGCCCFFSPSSCSASQTVEWIGNKMVWHKRIDFGAIDFKYLMKQIEWCLWLSMSNDIMYSVNKYVNDESFCSRGWQFSSVQLVVFIFHFRHFFSRHFSFVFTFTFATHTILCECTCVCVCVSWHTIYWTLSDVFFVAERAAKWQITIITTMK